MAGVTRTRARAAALRAALATVVVASAAPYGYTISIWSSGAMLLDAHGTPRPAEVFAFVAGGLCGFGVMALAARGSLARADGRFEAPDRVLGGALHWLAAGAAVGAAALVAAIDGSAAWPLTSFAATTIYIGAAGAQLAAVAALRARR